MIKKIVSALLISSVAFAGLPPTTSKVSSDANNITTFNYQFPNFTGTHTGITVSLGVNSTAGGGTGLSSPGGSGNCLISNGSIWTSASCPSFPTENANTVYAGPTSGAAATPTFRSQVYADISPAVKVPSTQAFASTPSTVGYRFTISSGSATVGATYTNNSNTYTVASTVASQLFVYMTNASAPTASGTLTKSGGTGDATLTFSANVAYGNYTVPTPAPAYLECEVQGAGGGGTGSGTSGGVTGLTSGTLSAFGFDYAKATGGGTGTLNNACTSNGLGSFLSPAIEIKTNPGGQTDAGPFTGTSPTTNYPGSQGGGAELGQGGSCSNGNVAGGGGFGVGGGGAGGGIGTVANANSGTGGCGGGYEKVIIPNPVAGVTYPVIVGVAGTHGAAGGSGANGGDGASGRVSCLERYQ